MLVHALVGCGREDLAGLMRDKEREFKREASISARGIHLIHLGQITSMLKFE